VQEEDVAPGVSLLESMRSVGYSFDAALADLVDNSITAGSTRVDIDADVIDGTYVAILDNGRGMSSEVARESLRLAGTSGDRDSQDLGRFGLGLKTASLSQGRAVTVATRADGVTSVLRWDIDHVLKTRRWSLLVLGAEEAKSLPLWPAFDGQNSGTLVIWERLDLLLGDSGDRGEHLREAVVKARESLSLIFHRYLRSGVAGFGITMNGAELCPIDPFLESNSRTQVSFTEPVPVGGQIVEVTAFTLPHPSGLTPGERARKDLSSGMREAQGLYIYRNRRLISHGNWHGLAVKSELTKQTRIRVDIPNTLDHLWQLDIKKSRTEPPASFKARLKRIIEPLLDRGRKVHTFRGRRTADAELVRVWDKIVDRNGKVAYSINREHPVLVLLRESLPTHQENILDSALELLATNYPAHDLFAVMAASGVASEDSPAEDAVLAKIRLLLEAGALGASDVEAAAQLALIEPFNQVNNLRDLVARAMGEETHGSH
jgi:hypothetical protein